MSERQAEMADTAQPVRTRESLSQVRQHLVSLLFFTRFSALGGTAILPILGAASISPDPGAPLLAGLLGVSVAYHLYAYVLNDVIDLPLDRTEPRRAAFPLVRGTISPGLALALALLQIPVALMLTAWLNGDRIAYATLCTSMALMAVYNLFGKRLPFPPLTDLVQGLAWGTLVLYGAALTPGTWTLRTAIATVYVVTFIVMANGVHGSLRDLANDLASGVRSTAILMGARPSGRAGVQIPPRLTAYAMVLNLVLIGLAMAPMAVNAFGYPPLARGLTTLGLLTLGGISLRLLLAAARSTDNHQTMNLAGMLHLLVLLGELIILFGPAMSPGLLTVGLSIFSLPLLTHSWLYQALRWGWQRFVHTRREPEHGRQPGRSRADDRPH